MRLTLRLEAEHGGLLYDRDAKRYQPLSAAETFMLVASREMSVGQAHATLANRVGVATALLSLSTLRAGGYFEGTGSAERFTGRVVELPALEGAYGAPFVAHVGITLACNYSCTHCYSSSGKRAPGELTRGELFSVIDQLADMGCMQLVLGGGEPFMRQELPQLVRYADARGVDTFIHTNGSLLTTKILRELSACPPAALSVSVDGPDALENDGVRGTGTFERTRAGMQQLREHYAPGFSIACTITLENAARSAEMVEMAKREGATALRLRPAYPAGRAAGELALACDRDTFAESIDVARARADELGVELDAPHPHSAEEPDFEGFGCVAARMVLGITPAGDVTPCLNLSDEFLSGNVRRASIARLWSSGDSFGLIRDVTPNPQCDSCRHYDTCRGGCRVRALHTGNGLDGPDSWCHYEPKVGYEPELARARRVPLFVIQ